MRMRKVRMAAIAGIAALSMVVAACGSSADDAGDTGSTDSESSSSEQPSEPQDNGESDNSDNSDNSSDDSSATEGDSDEGSSDTNGVDAAKATSAADFGGMEGLVKAAQAEGQLNVIALPPDWANYGKVIKAFSEKYDIKVNSQNPGGSSAEEIQAAETNAGTDKAPDVFDLGTAVALANLDVFAPYKVQAWDAIPDTNKHPDGLWVNDYAGVMSVGYNASKYGEITSLDDLKDPKFKGTVALNGNPNQAGAAFSGVVMAALANGGSADDISAGVDFFVALKEAGTFAPVNPTPATIASGQTGVVFDWSYNQLAAAGELAKQDVEWKTYVPDGAAVGAYYNQAINADAPHPAAARLWEEFLFSPEAQNLWMAGGAQPILLDKMKADGTVDPEAAKNLPKTSSPIVTLTADQQKAAADYLAKNWSKVAG